MCKSISSVSMCCLSYSDDFSLSQSTFFFLLVLVLYYRNAMSLLNDASFILVVADRSRERR